VCGREFERHALTEAYSVPLLWWDRIVATSAKLKGWEITPRHFIGQDLLTYGSINETRNGRPCDARLRDFGSMAIAVDGVAIKMGDR
jgi:hypothetical protein